MIRHLVIALCLLLVVGFGVRHFWAEPATTITFEFKPTHKGEPFVFGTPIYDNPGGEGKYGFRDFRFYASNLMLKDGQHAYVVPDSYHLVRFDADTQSHSFDLPDIPLRRLSNVTLSIGLDETANGSIEPKGDLDPNSRMAWNWTIGYKFLLAEGGLQISGQNKPLVYHVGFDENRRELSFEIPLTRRSDDITVSFEVDISTLFDGASKIDMATLSTVKMHRPDAARLADNYAKMLRLLP